MTTDTKSKLYIVSLYDKLLIILILSLSLVFLLSFNTSEPKYKKCVIYHDGNLFENIVLNKNQIKELNLPEGNMTLEIKEGRIRVLESSCPHGLCVDVGWIETDRMPIVCVPNKVIIEIKGDDSNYDAISQ